MTSRAELKFMQQQRGRSAGKKKKSTANGDRKKTSDEIDVDDFTLPTTKSASSSKDFDIEEEKEVSEEEEVYADISPEKLTNMQSRRSSPITCDTTNDVDVNKITDTFNNRVIDIKDNDAENNEVSIVECCHFYRKSICLFCYRFLILCLLCICVIVLITQ
tara:strand:+ start:1287 stop:1769 length:483 start_codon:yes stop_codon:yes gene_type:complete